MAPPAVSGGTLIVLPDGRAAVAADPDRDRVYLVDLGVKRVTATVVLAPRDEPGRLIADRHGHVHVSLRGGGALVTIDPVAGIIVQRRPVCAAPRGLAHDPITDLIHVACANGELISLPAAGGDLRRAVWLDDDLRDVVVEGDSLRVSRFRSAEIITVAADGTVSGRTTLGNFRSPLTRGGQLFTPSVAWRMVGVPGGGVAMIHQRGVVDDVQQGTIGSYGGKDQCDAIVHSAVTRFRADGAIAKGPALPGFPLAVDVAVSPDGTQVALISASNGHSMNGAALDSRPSLHVAAMDALSDERTGCRRDAERGPCDQPAIPGGNLARCAEIVPTVVGEAIAVAFAPDGAVIVQSREPAVLNIPGGVTIQLAPDSRNDTGHLLFHANAGAGLACASCHAEGRDDGRVWNFVCAGGRRTQSLQAGIRGTEPFHWDGDQGNFPQLIRDVFTARMSGPVLTADHADAMLSWLDHQPRLAARSPVDRDAVARGRAIYNDSRRGNCAHCHVGPQLTNSQTVDVGTGGAFQVPSLVGIAAHAPFLHNGCAQTLRERFSPSCGGGDKHGKTSDLMPAELADLISYLETL